MKAANFQICNPASKKHRMAMMWFASITNAVEQFKRPETAPVSSSLKRSIEFYSIYAETADERYLNLCEDFLKDSLAQATR